MCHASDRRYGLGTWGSRTRSKKKRVFGSGHSTIHGVTPLTGVIRSWGPRTRNNTRVFDSGNSTIQGVTPLTGVLDVGSPYTNSRYIGAGLSTPESLTVVFAVGHSRESHGSLWAWALQIFSGVERSRRE